MRAFILVACLAAASAITVSELKKRAAKPAARDLAQKVGSNATKAGSAKQAKKAGNGKKTPWVDPERAGLSKFFYNLGTEMVKRDANGFSWGSYRWGLDSPGLRNHPARVDEMKDAKYVVLCCLEEGTKNQFLNLPKRTPETPYLVKMLASSKSLSEVFEKRPDFLAMNYDLRDSMDKQDMPLRGITIAPHNYFNGKRMKVDHDRKFFVTFQGRKTSKLRHELHDAFNLHRKFGKFQNISVETVMDRMWNVKQQTGDAKFNMKMNSTYVLLPKGDDRWSLRFAETLGAGGIPVIMADGLTLPYEHIIDWSKAVIRLPNNYSTNADEIMKRLPSDKETILKMRQAVYDINAKYFTNPNVRADAMLKEADAVVKNGGKYAPLWKPEEAEPWLESNRVGATEESKAVAFKLAQKFEPAKIHRTYAQIIADKAAKAAQGSATTVEALLEIKSRKPTLITRN